MKAYELYRTLTAPERKAFSKLVNTQGRPKMSKLHKLFQQWTAKSRKVPPEKEDLHKACLNESYTERRDYLIRNELRKYAELIRRFLVEKHMEKRLNTEDDLFNETLLQALAERRKLGLLEKEYKSARQKALSKQAFGKAADLDALYFTSTINHTGPQNRSFHKFFIRLTQESLHFRQKDAKEKILDMLLKRSYCENQLSMNFENDIGAEINSLLNIDSEKNTSVYAHYLTLRIEAYRSSGLEKISILEKIAGLADNLQHCTDLDSRLIETMANFDIGREYHIIKDFKNAVNYYGRTFELADFYKLQLPPLAYLSYCLSLIVTGNYALCFHYAGIIRERYANNPFIYFEASVHTTISLIWQNEAAKARKIYYKLDQNPINSESPWKHRFLILMIDFTQDDLSVAWREALNLENSLTKTYKNKEALRLLRHFKSFLNIAYNSRINNQAKKFKKRLIAIRSKLDKDIEHMEDMRYLICYALWLREKVRQHIE